MAEKTVEANVRTLGYSRGDRATIEVTPFVQSLLDRGILSIVEDDDVIVARRRDQPDS